MIGLVSVFISGQVINKVLTLGSEASKTLFIISPKWEEIRDAINQELDRGVTLVPALGGYANEQRMMVMTVVKQKQFANRSGSLLCRQRRQRSTGRRFYLWQTLSK